jgi:mannose/fructose/N-acetylgalactosamine-specific phosphotransferase system component IIC
MSGLELWLAWGGVALVGALLALDETSLAQTWLSQPLPAALLAGLVVGEPAAALVPGFFMQLIVLGNLPVGAASTLDATSATVGVVAGALIGGWNPPEGGSPLVAFSGEAAWPVGLQMVLMALASLAGGRLIRLQRQAHLAWKLAAYRRIRDGDFTMVDRLHRKALVVAAARGGAMSLLIAAVVAIGWSWSGDAVPAAGREILARLPLVAVPLAVATLSERFGHPRAVPVLVVTVGLGLAAGWWLA